MESLPAKPTTPCRMRWRCSTLTLLALFSATCGRGPLLTTCPHDAGSRLLPRLRGGSARFLLTQQIELSQSPEEAAELLTECVPEDMANFATPEGVNRVLAVMLQFPPPAIAETLPALLLHAQGRTALWRRGSTISRTLRLLSDLHHSVALPTKPPESSPSPTDADFDDSCPRRHFSWAVTDVGEEPLRALAQSLAYRALDPDIVATFSAAAVADVLASLAALGFHGSEAGHADADGSRPTGDSRSLAGSMLEALQRRAAQTPIANAREGCDLLWPCAALRWQSPELIAHVCAALFSPHCGGGGGYRTPGRDTWRISPTLADAVDLLAAAVDGKWLTDADLAIRRAGRELITHVFRVVADAARSFRGEGSAALSSEALQDFMQVLRYMSSLAETVDSGMRTRGTPDESVLSLLHGHAEVCDLVTDCLRRSDKGRGCDRVDAMRAQASQSATNRRGVRPKTVCSRAEGISKQPFSFNPANKSHTSQVLSILRYGALSVADVVREHM